MKNRSARVLACVLMVASLFLSGCTEAVIEGVTSGLSVGVAAVVEDVFGALFQDVTGGV